VVPDKPVLHLLQQQGRFTRRQVDRVEIAALVLDVLDQLELSPAAVASVAQRVGERDLHEDLPSHADHAGVPVLRPKCPRSRGGDSTARQRPARGPPHP